MQAFIRLLSLSLAYVRINSGECVTLHIATKKEAEGEALLTQNFRSYLAFYYYDCFLLPLGLSLGVCECMCVCSLLILLLTSLASDHFTLFMRDHAFVFPFFFFVRNMFNQPQSVDSVIYLK